MTFSEALELLKQGKKVKRAEWGGFWIYVKNPLVLDDDSEISDGFRMNPTIFASLKDGGGYTAATAYQSDILSEDWEEVE